jgi:hypothetical protein
MALDYGSGLIIGSNDWGSTPQTHDGGLFKFNTDIVDIDLGYYRNNTGLTGEDNAENMLVNVGKSDGDWSVNGLYMSTDDGLGGETTGMGIDAGYSLMSGSLDLSVSYNTGSVKAGLIDLDMDMMVLGLGYNVNDDLNLSVSRTTNGDQGYASSFGSNYGYGTGSWGD